MATPESKIKAKVNKFLKPLIDAGKVHKLMPVQRGLGAVGLDYHLCVAGHYVAIETKAGGDKKLTPRQRNTADKIIDAGGKVYVVCDDESLESAMALISNCIATPAWFDDIYST